MKYIILTNLISSLSDWDNYKIYQNIENEKSFICDSSSTIRLNSTQIVSVNLWSQLMMHGVD